MFCENKQSSLNVEHLILLVKYMRAENKCDHICHGISKVSPYALWRQLEVSPRHHPFHKKLNQMVKGGKNWQFQEIY